MHPSVSRPPSKILVGLRIGLCVCIASLTGCAQNTNQFGGAAPLYAPPTNGPTAKLLLRVQHPGGRYTISTYEQPIGCSHRQEFVSATVREPERQAVVIAANRLRTISFMHVLENRQACQVILSFEPKAGATYLMRNFADAKGCNIDLINASNPEQPVRESSAIERERVGLGLIDNACKGLASTTPARPPKGIGTAASSGTKPDSLESFKDLLPGK